jgi:hypothetical protein
MAFILSVTTSEHRPHRPERLLSHIAIHPFGSRHCIQTQWKRTLPELNRRILIQVSNHQPASMSYLTLLDPSRYLILTLSLAQLASGLSLQHWKRAIVSWQARRTGFFDEVDLGGLAVEVQRQPVIRRLVNPGPILIAQDSSRVSIRA